jgi:hypothetical protein
LDTQEETLVLNIFKFRRQENGFGLKLPYLEGLFEISKSFVPNPHGILLNLVGMVTLIQNHFLTYKTLKSSELKILPAHPREMINHF